MTYQANGAAPKINWDVPSLDAVLEQSARYEVMLREAREGMRELASQDDERGEVDGDTPPNWYHSASEMGDRVTCRMIELLRDNGDDPQDVYDAAWDELHPEGA